MQASQGHRSTLRRESLQACWAFLHSPLAVACRLADAAPRPEAQPPYAPDAPGAGSAGGAALLRHAAVDMFLTLEQGQGPESP